jgi:hypothetical protein
MHKKGQGTVLYTTLMNLERARNFGFERRRFHRRLTIRLVRLEEQTDSQSLDET